MGCGHPKWLLNPLIHCATMTIPLKKKIGGEEEGERDRVRSRDEAPDFECSPIIHWLTCHVQKPGLGQAKVRSLDWMPSLSWG